MHSETIFQWEQSLKVRWLLWGQCVESLFDLLFMAMGAVVIASIWRSFELFAGFKYQQKLHIKSTPTQATTIVSTTTTSTTTTTTTQTLSSSLQYERFLEGMRGTIFMEFLCTLRDLLCVLPMAIVIASLYRLPQLLVELYGLVFNSKSALHTEALFEVDSCHIEFPEKGGPHINFYCHRKSSSIGGTVTSTTDDANHNNINPLTGDARDHTTTATTTTTTTVNTSEAVVVDGSTFQLDTSSSSIEMYVSGDDLWKHAADTFGQVVVSAVRNYLPLKLVDQVSVGWSDFVHNEFMHYSSMDNHRSNRPSHPHPIPPMPPPAAAAAAAAAAATDDDNDDVVRNLHASIDRGAVSILTDNHQTDANTSLWLRLDFGTTKRSTILKKLRLLPATTTIQVQLETMVTVLDPMASHVTHRKQYEHHHQMKKKVVLLRVAPTIRNIINVLETITTTGTSSVAAGLLPIDALNKPPVYRRDQAVAAATAGKADVDDDDIYDPKNRVSNLVNSFHMTVCLICIEVLIDLAMLILLCMTMISPVRFARLMYTLLEPENKLPLRIMQHTMSGIKYLDGHLLSYRREIAVPCNVMAKSIKCKLLKPSRYDVDNSFNSWYYNEADNARYQLEVSDFHSSPDHEYFQQVAGFIDKRHYRPYVKLAKSSKKTLSLFPGCESMEVLLDERLRLYHLVIKLRYMRITADLSYMTPVTTNTSSRNVNTGE